MKRCPECGFRANDTVCPLCGVRMTGGSSPVQTHSHTQTGEKCVLPNRERPTSERENRETERPGSHRKRNGTTPSSLVTTIIVIVLISMLRSCMG